MGRTADRRRRVSRAWAAGSLAAFLALALLPSGSALAATPVRLSSFADASGLETVPIPLRASGEWVPVGQAEWGWWPWSRQVEQAPGPEEDGAEAEEEEEGSGPAYGEAFGRVAGSWARAMRIGIEFGGFFPFGAKEETFRSGQMGGLLLGFGLPPVVSGLVVTNEVRILEGTTSSEDQAKGYDVSSLLFAVKDDFLFHFFPESKAFNVHWFLGISLGIERTTATKGSTETTSTDVWFLADTGFGAWLNLAGPLDLILRLEFDVIPVTKNVPFYAVGLIGLQARF